MKRFSYYLFLFPVVVALSSFLPSKTLKALHPANEFDSPNYRLSIIEANIVPLKDTVFGGNHCLIAKCPLTLTNNTNDTLKYAGMSASWWDFYSLDNKNFALAADYWNVFKNGPVVHILLPHQSITNNIKIITLKDYFRGEKLKIAMRLEKVVRLPIIGEIKSIESDSNFLIWSNEVVIR
jgi:hypothetical protein